MDFYTIKDVEEKLGLCRQTIVKLILDKKSPLPAFKIGQKWRIPKEEFEVWLVKYRKG